MNPSVVSGTLVGTGALMTVALGFVPASVELINVGSATKEELKWVTGMAQDSGLKTIDAARSIVVANAISTVGASDSDTVEQGFTIGTDADLNVDGENIFYIAARSGAGAQ